MSLHSYLNTPIPRKTALVIVIGQAAANSVVVFSSVVRVVRRANAIIGHQDESLRIFRESLDFLLERADEATVDELNQKLDFWRVVREMSPDADEE